MDFAKAVEQSLGITDPEQQMQVFSSMLALLKAVGHKFEKVQETKSIEVPPQESVEDTDAEAVDATVEEEVTEETVEDAEVEEEALEVAEDPAEEAVDAESTEAAEAEPETAEAEPAEAAEEAVDAEEEPEEVEEAEPVTEKKSPKKESEPIVEKKSSKKDAEPVVEKKGSKKDAEPAVVEKKSSKKDAEPAVVEKKGSKSVPEPAVVEKKGSKKDAEPVVEKKSKNSPEPAAEKKSSKPEPVDEKKSKKESAEVKKEGPKINPKVSKAAGISLEEFEEETLEKLSVLDPENKDDKVFLDLLKKRFLCQADCEDGFIHPTLGVLKYDEGYLLCCATAETIGTPAKKSAAFWDPESDPKHHEMIVEHLEDAERFSKKDVLKMKAAPKNDVTKLLKKLRKEEKLFLTNEGGGIWDGAYILEFDGNVLIAHQR